MDCYRAEFLTVEEGLCVQIMHQGPFDEEPVTVAIMDQYIFDNGYRNYEKIDIVIMKQEDRIIEQEWDSEGTRE